MSLFPAYAEHSENSEKSTAQDTDKWLENSSFPSEIALQKSANETTKETRKKVPSGSEGEIPKKRRKKEKKKRKKQEKPHPDPKPCQPPVDESQGFVIDTTRIVEYTWVDTIARPAAPRYHVVNAKHRKYKRKKFKRYFKVLIEKNPEKSNSDNDSVITKQNLYKVGFSDRDENFTGLKQEENLSKKTEKFNKRLAEEPNNIKTWLEYVRFQDTVYEFEKNYRKGSIAKAQRVLAERKISILEKALSLNPDCEDLLRERIKVSVSTFPSDELQEQLAKLVDKQKDNIILWQGYIEATQCSMSHCNTPAVLNLYTKCLSTLHQLRRTTTLEKLQLEENILRMLYQCGLFLKQAGLFEQLWTLLRMYLELNLAPADKAKFNISSKFEDKQLVELEETVFGSQLPLHELWLRTEKLRESCHWLPYVEEGECEDPQRIVFTEDVAELIHPITTEENVFKLVATVLTLLKVPLLPCRHVTMQELGLDYVPWSLDSIEALLSSFYPLYVVDVTNDYLLNDTVKLAVGPQYLKMLPAQEEYLEFVLATMQNCADCLNGDDKNAVLVWWIRFQKLLVVLDKQNRFKMPQYLKKKVKTNIKNALKREEYRTNEVFYAEYALIEYESGNFEACINVLKTAISMNKNQGILKENFSREQTNQCFLYRTLVECYLKQNKRLEALESLTRLALQRNFEKLTNGILLEAKTKFNVITDVLSTTKLEKHIPVCNFLPDFCSDWILCQAYFIYLTGDIKECLEFVKNVLNGWENENKSTSWQEEVLHEFYAAMFYKFCEDTPGMFKTLDETLHKSIELFPNNVYTLVVLAKEQSSVFSLGPAWWKLQSLLLKSGRANAAIFAIAIADQLNSRAEKCFPDSPSPGIGPGLKNRTLSLFKKATKPDSATRRCGLIWRLYLQFVYTHFDAKMCRDVYYSAVEECPWLKVLYIDAAIYIPAELDQIQDLIVEKQLRLHVTPEELDVLRN